MNREFDIPLQVAMLVAGKSPLFFSGAHGCSRRYDDQYQLSYSMCRFPETPDIKSEYAVNVMSVEVLYAVCTIFLCAL
jgi:hypothetical protein